MMVRVEAALFELQVIGFSPGRQRQKPPEELVLTGFFPLRQERFRVIGVFEIAIAVVTSDMAGDEVLTQVETQPVGIGFQREGLAREVGRDRVAVGVQG